jgi:hypothetical protein
MTDRQLSTPCTWCSKPRAWKAMARSARPQSMATVSTSEGSIPQIRATCSGG